MNTGKQCQTTEDHLSKFDDENRTKSDEQPEHDDTPNRTEVAQRFSK